MATALTQEQYEAVVNAIKAATGSSNYTWSYPWNALNNGKYTAKDFYDLMHTSCIKCRWFC